MEDEVDVFDPEDVVSLFEEEEADYEFEEPDSDNSSKDFEEPDEEPFSPSFQDETESESVFSKITNLVRKDTTGPAGVDLHPPRHNDPDPFLDKLAPVSNSELVMLQQDTRSEELIYMKTTRHYRNYYWRYNLSMLLSVLFTLSFVSILGGEYFTEKLINPTLPAYLTDTFHPDVLNPIYYILGILVLLGIVVILARGFKALLSIVGTRDFKEVLFLASSIFFAGWTMVLTANGDVLTAVLAVIVYWVVNGILKAILGKTGVKQKSG